MPDEKSCGVVLFSENGERLYLILNYSAGHWDFPKGHVEPEESEAETALRELSEETGISDVELIKGFRERIEYDYQRGLQKMHKEVVFFLGHTSSPEEARLSHEHIGYEWLSPEKAMARLTFETAKDILKKAEGALESWGASR